MMQPRFFLLLMVTALVGPGACISGAQFEPGMVITGFRVPDYDDEGRLKLQLFGDQAQAVSSTVLDITNLRIETFQEDEVDMRVMASRCRFDQAKGVATSDQDVRITRQNLIISGMGFRWESEPTRFEIHRDARVVIRGARSRNPSNKEAQP